MCGHRGGVWFRIQSDTRARLSQSVSHDRTRWVAAPARDGVAPKAVEARAGGCDHRMGRALASPPSPVSRGARSTKRRGQSVQYISYLVRYTYSFYRISTVRSYANFKYNPVAVGGGGRRAAAAGETGAPTTRGSARLTTDLCGQLPKKLPPLAWPVKIASSPALRRRSFRPRFVSLSESCGSRDRCIAWQV